MTASMSQSGRTIPVTLSRKWSHNDWDDFRRTTAIKQPQQHNYTQHLHCKCSSNNHDKDYLQLLFLQKGNTIPRYIKLNVRVLNFFSLSLSMYSTIVQMTTEPSWPLAITVDEEVYIIVLCTGSISIYIYKINKTLNSL